MNLDDMIAAERSAPAQATPTQADEVWKSIESSFVSVLPPAGAPLAAAKASTLGKFGAALTSTTGKLLLATSLVAGGVMTGRGLGEADRETPSVQRSPRGREAASPAVSAPPAVASTLPEAQPISAPEPEPEPEPGLEAPSQDAPHARARTQAPTTRATTKPPSSMQEELALIQKTQSALRTGAHDRALALVREHATTYPDGAFVEDREALRTLALCGSGDSKASGTASTFLNRWPQSMHRTRIEAACE